MLLWGVWYVLFGIVVLWFTFSCGERGFVVCLAWFGTLAISWVDCSVFINCLFIVGL